MKSKGGVVITGSSTGIGHACALNLDELGYRVFAGVRSEADAAALSKKASARLKPLLFDVTRKEDISAAARIIDSEVGQEGLAALVNNAGICLTGPLEYTGLADLRHQMEVNVIGLVAVTQTFLPLL